MSLRRILILASIMLVFWPSGSHAKTVISDSQVAMWAQTSATAIMNFDFMTFDKKKEDNKKFFTQKGYDSFYSAMDAARIPDTIKAKKMMLQGEVKCSPEVISHKSDNGVETWEVEFSLGLDYISGDDIKTDRQKITMFVKSGSTTSAKGDLGLGIEQWVAAPLSDSEKSVCGSKEQMKARIGQLRREIGEREAEVKALEAQLP